MFRESITSPLVSGVGASSMFKSIQLEGTTMMMDETFLSSLRALLYPRIGDGKLRLAQKQVQIKSLRDEPIEMPGLDTMSLFFFRQAGNEEIRERLKSEIENPEMFPGWERIEKVTAFYQRTAPVYCFVNREKRATILFVLARPERQIYHYLQSGIPAYFPWYFDPKAGISDLEKRLLASLTKDKPDEYQVCMEEFSALYKLRDEGIRALVGDIESRYEKTEAERLKNRLNEVMEIVRSLENQLRDNLKTKRELDVRMKGLRVLKTDEPKESPLVGYFINNRKAEVVASDDDSITVLVRETCSIYDDNEAESAINDRRSQIYEGDGDLDNSDMELLMRAIFLDHTLQLNFCSAYRLYLSGGCDGLRHYEYGAKYADCMPNPHIEHYACTGDYGDAIRAALQDGDMIGGIETAIASCASLNFTDGAVMEEFIEDIQGNHDVNTRCIVLPDGSVVRPAEAVEYLRG